VFFLYVTIIQPKYNHSKSIKSASFGYGFLGGSITAWGWLTTGTDFGCWTWTGVDGCVVASFFCGASSSISILIP
jgi:hypothetical protein